MFYRHFEFIFVLLLILKNETMDDKTHLSYIMENFQLQYITEKFSIAYENSEGDIEIKKRISPTFFLQVEDIDPQKVVWMNWKGLSFPCLGDCNVIEEIITIENNHPVIHVDIIFGVFYFLSGWNECFHLNKDAIGRVSFKESMIYQLNIINIPVVNIYFDILSKALTMAGIVNRRKQPEGFEFSAVLTHDIDQCQSAWLEGGFSELKQRRLATVTQLLWKRILGRDDWFNFETIMSIEHPFEASSSFYFLPHKGKKGGLKNADYDVRCKNIQKIIQRLRETGREVGVHGSIGSHHDSNQLKKDISCLGGSIVMGNRFHYLMFDPEKTVQILEDCGIKYDTSLMFAEHVGFRRGCCSPFYLYDFERNRISSVIEIPLIVMDTTFRNKHYMGIPQGKVLEEIKPLIDVTQQFNGMLTILWHNNFFSDYKYAGWRQLYVELLQYMNEQKAWLTNGEQVYNMYTQ